MNVVGIISLVVTIYSYTILIYILLSWFQTQAWAQDMRQMLEPVVEPYIGLFRRIVPTTGMMDFSPLVAILVLQYLVRPALLLLASALGL